MRRRRVLLFMLALALGSPAAAQVCGAELQRALPGASSTPGQVAAALLARAVQLIEPALPAQLGGSGPIEGAGAAADAVTYLHQRRLLPAGWTPDGHTPAAWEAMIARFVEPYREDPPPTTGATTPAMLREVGAALAVVADAVRPLPVFAVDGEGALTFFAVIWNWTPFPRLLIFRPDPGARLADGAGPHEAALPVLEAMANCALRFEHFAYAGEGVAIQLFVAQGTSTLRVMGSDPALAGLPRVFEADEVVDVLTFRSAALDGVDAASVSIEGPAPGLGSVLQVLVQVRTNAGLEVALRSLALP